MTLTRKVSSITLPASGDISANQFRIMTIDDVGRLVAGVNNATPFVGVLLNKPAAIDRAGEVAIRGSVVKLTAGAAVAERDAITSVAGGRGSPTTTAGDYIIGRALTPAAASGVLFEVEVSPDRYSGTSV